MSPVYLARLAQRWQAAVDMERARQITRENGRYGRATDLDMQRVRNAELAYDLATVACWSPA